MADPLRLEEAFESMTEDRHIIDEQIAYYRARAPECDEWFLRQGRYNRGTEHSRAWFQESARVEESLSAANPRGEILELACGTGLWTRHLVNNLSTVTAVDASPESLYLNEQRVQSPGVSYVEADLFVWRPAQQYDFIFFSFWLSHVPADRFEPFWQLVRSALKSHGRVFFLDNLFTQESTALDHQTIDRNGTVQRRLNDGRAFEIVKVFYEPSELQRRLLRLGWEGYVRSTPQFFIFGCVQPNG